MADALDQAAPDAREDRRHEAQPETRQVGREHRHRNQPAAQPALPGVLAHQVAVRDDVGATDFEYFMVGRLAVERRLEIAEHVINRNWLGRKSHPGRRDHHRQPLDQRADHLERQAAAADDDRRAKLRDRNARFAQARARVESRAEVWRQFFVRIGETAQIDDASDASGTGGGAEVDGGYPLGVFEAFCPAERVRQVVRRFDARERGTEGRAIQQVALDDLGGRSDPITKELRAPGEASHGDALRFESPKQAATDVAGGARQQDARCGVHGSTGWWGTRTGRPRRT